MPNTETLSLRTVQDVRNQAQESGADIELEHLILGGTTPVLNCTITLEAGCSIRTIKHTSTLEADPINGIVVAAAEFSMTDGSILVGLYQDGIQSVAAELTGEAGVDEWFARWAAPRGTGA